MADEILIRFSVKDDGSPVIEKVNQKLGQTKKQSEALVPGLENARSKLTSFASENAALIGVLVGVGAALKNVIDTGIEYAMTVDEMARAGGQSTEEASRFLQVLDDYEISAQDALAATRALTNNGLAPNIETLAALSDQYRSIQDPMEKNEFIIKNLGRGGLQWAKALDMGSAALLEQAAAVDKNLIMTEKQVRQADAARLAIDGWNESIDALKLSLSVKLLPTLTDVATAMSNNEKKGANWLEFVVGAANPIMQLAYGVRDLITAHQENEAAMQDGARATKEYGASQKDLEAAAKQAEAAQKNLSDAIDGQISLINQMQSAEEDYNSKIADLTTERIKIEQEKQALINQGYDDSAEGLQEYQDKLADYDGQLATIAQKEADLATERDRQAIQFVSNILAEQLARDGWTQTEFEAFAKQQEAWGLWSADVVAKAQTAWQEADKLAASIHAVDPVLQAQQEGFTTWASSAQSSIGGVRGSIDELKQAFANSGNFAGFDRIDMESQSGSNNGSGKYVIGQSYNGSTYLGAGVWKGYANGGSFEIPSEYGFEGFRMGANSTASAGERVTITPKNKDIIDYDRMKNIIDYDRLARVVAVAVRDALMVRQ